MKKILMIINTSRASGRKFLAGAERCISTFTDWEVYLQAPDYLQTGGPGFELGFPLDKLDGLLIRDAANALRGLPVNLPKVVNDTRREITPGASSIVTESVKIGQIAADYFLGRGFKHFAFCGFEGFPWSRKRYDGFSGLLGQQGIETVFHFDHDRAGHPQSVTERWKIAEWLKRLPRPLCVLACNDDRGLTVLEACKIAGLNVPEEVAVLVVDNDELMCNLSSPSLSSMELDFEQAGFAAARQLNDLIDNKTENRIIPVSPVEVVTRRSTDVLALNDDDVVAALVFIRQYYHQPIQAADVVNAACRSKRELEKRFKKLLNRTIKEEIERLRIAMIKKKLANSSQSIHQIAADLEFTDPEHFSRYFRNATGQTPLQFRRSR